MCITLYNYWWLPLCLVSTIKNIFRRWCRMISLVWGVFRECSVCPSRTYSTEPNNIISEWKGVCKNDIDFNIEQLLIDICGGFLGQRLFTGLRGDGGSAVVIRHMGVCQRLLTDICGREVSVVVIRCMSAVVNDVCAF